MGLMTARPSSAKLSDKNPYFIDINERPDWQNLFGNCQPIKLEIGFGMGDFLIEMAVNEAHSNFIGIDFSKSGALNLLAQIKSLQLNNIRVAYGDVRNKIPLLFEDAGLNTIYINFPDPWPKKRHIKRRLIKPKFVKLLAQKLAPKGQVYLATDSQLYAQEMFDYFNADPLFQNINLESGFLESRDNLPRTKYEKSFIYADEKIYYLEYSRVPHAENAAKPFRKKPLIETAVYQSQQTEIKPKNKDMLLVEQFENAEAKAKDTCDMKKVADDIAAAGNKEWAKKVYIKAEGKAEDTLDYNWLAYSVAEILCDKEWAKALYKKAESTAKNSLEFNWLAYSIFETLGNKEWTKSLYKKAAGKRANVRELCDLADSISKTLGDTKWRKTIYKKAADKAHVFPDFYELADIIYEQLDDGQKAIELYKKAEDKAEDSGDLHSLAESIYAKFRDTEWAIKVYTKAESEAKDSDDFCGLADSLCENLGDEETAIRLYKKAESQAKASYEFRDIADSMCNKLGDREWAKKMYAKSENKAETFYEFHWLANCIYENIGDQEWAKRVSKKAEGKARYQYEINCLANGIYKKLGVKPTQ